MTAVYTGINYDETIKQVSVARPSLERTEFQKEDVIVVDTCCLVRGVFLERIKNYQRAGKEICITGCVAEETRELTARMHHKGDITAQELERAITYVRQMYSEGKVIDMKRDRGKRVEEERKYLEEFSFVLSKAFLEETICSEYERIYHKIKIIEEEKIFAADSYRKRAQDILNEEASEKSSTGIKSIRKCIRQIQRKACEEREKRLYALSNIIKADVDCEAFLAERNESANAQNLCLEKALAKMFWQISERKEGRDAQEEYRIRKEAGASTDREIVLASYAVIAAAGDMQRKVGIATVDVDIRELVALRNHTRINYAGATI